MEPALRIFVPVAIRDAMSRVVPRLQAATARTLDLMVDLNPAISWRIGAGETFDIGLTNPHHVKVLIASGHVDGASHRAFGRVPLAVARRARSPGPVLTGVDDIIALLTEAGAVGYTAAGTSGMVYLDTVALLGLTETMAVKSHPMDAGEPVAAVAAGTLPLAVVPLTTVLSSPGVELAAIFPDALGAHIDISVFQSPWSGAGSAAALDLLISSQIDDLLAPSGVVRFTFD